VIEKPFVQFLQCGVSIGVIAHDVLHPVVRESVQVEHACCSNTFLKIGLLEEEPAHHFRSQVWIIWQIGRAVGEMHQDGA